MAFRLRPLHEDKLHFADLSNTQILILALEASQKLEWNIEGIALREVIFYVPMGMRSQGEEVTFTIEEGNSGEISVRSQCASVQLVDYGKNRKNIQKLQETMEEIKSTLTPEELAMKMIRDVLQTTGITATAGIGTNLYLSKIAMDIVAKHIEPNKDGVRIARLD